MQYISGLRKTLASLSGGASVLVVSVSVANAADTGNLSHLINTGNYEQAAKVLASQNPSPADQLFFDGRVLKAQGRFEEAIETFRQVLRIDPNYLNARRELAHTLMLNHEYEAAEYNFGELMRIDSNPSMRDGYRRFLAAISDAKPVGMSGFIAILPSTNVNRGTSNTVFNTSLGEFVINDESKAKSGIGVRAGVNGFVRYLMTPSSRLVLNWGATGTVYGHKSYNYLVGDVSVAYEKVTDRGFWAVRPYYRRAWHEDNNDNDALGAAFDFRYRLDEKNRLGFSAAYEERTYQWLDYLNGGFGSASASLTHQISPSMSVSAVAGYETYHPKAAHLKYDSYRGLVDMVRSWKGGLRTGLGFEYGRRHYDGDYPLTGSPRRDTFYKVLASVQYSKIDIRGFTPNLYCSHNINHSNVAFYDYNASECQVVMSKEF